MSISRKCSLDPVKIPDWRWAPFLNEIIKAFSDFDLEPYPIAQDFLEKESVVRSKLKPQRVFTETWACKTKKLRQVRAACLEAGSYASVMNFVINPFHIFELPFFGADFVTLASGHLLALDFQPVLKNDKLHTQEVWRKLLPLHDHWQGLLKHGGLIPKEAQQFFSPGFLWARLPLGEEGDELISNVLMPAFIDYLELYLNLVREAKVVSSERSALLFDGQKRYIAYRAENDPAKGMLKKFYGQEWTDSYIHKVLFDL